MKRFIPWYDIVIYLPLVVLLFFAAFIFTIYAGSQSFVAVFGLWVFCGGFSIVSLAMVFGKYFASPDYITRQGVRVWTEARENMHCSPKLSETEKYLEAFFDILPLVLTTARDLEPCERMITRAQLSRFCRELNILYTTHTTMLVGPGWTARDVYSATRKNMIAVRYTYPFTPVHLYHALWHAIDTCILRRAADCRHKRAAWWQALLLVQTKVLGLPAQKNLPTN